MAAPYPFAAAILAGLGVTLGSCASFDDLDEVGSGAPRSARCGQCHVEIHHEWQGSSHAGAFRSDAFLSHSDRGRIERCTSCHAPEPLGESPGRPLAARSEAREEGVHCLSCHSVESGHGESNRRALMAGPLGSEALVDPHPIDAQPERFRDAAFCGRCHEDTYREWVASGTTSSSTCQTCHMPSVLRKVTQPTGLVSGVLVSLEPTLPLRAHEFSTAAAVEESPRVLGSDFLELRIVKTGGSDRIEVENVLPHSIPTGGFGGKRLALVIEVDGSEIARRELTNRPGKALACNEVFRCEPRFPGNAGSHRVEASLVAETREPPRSCDPLETRRGMGADMPGGTRAGRFRKPVMPQAESAPRPKTEREGGILRFDATERRLHWALVVPYLALGGTGSWLVIGDALGESRSAREAIVTAHFAAGCALVILPVLVLAFSRPEPFIGLFREAWRWRLADLAWLLRSFLRILFPRVRLPAAGRFNAGQRLNLLHTFALLPLVAVTGFACRVVPAAILIRAIHAAGALASLLVAAGHMYLALVNPSTRAALGSMFHGRVSLAYAEHHHPAWFEEATGRRAAEPAPAGRRVSRLAMGLLAVVLVSSAVLVHGPARRGAWEALGSVWGSVIEEPLRPISPAPLSPLHAAEKDLVRCTACHDLRGVVSSERCLRCHEPIGRRIADGKGYHGRIRGECASCHADHQPELIALEDEWFNHDQAAFRLRGKHIGLSCDSCHRKGEDRRRYVGLETGSGCASCHDDPHGRPEAICSSCHDEDGSWSAGGFDHQTMARFSLDGIHRALRCGACHGDGEKHRFRYGPTGEAAAAEAFSCTGCHGIIANALRGEIAGLRVAPSPHDGKASCVDCHDGSSASNLRACSSCHPADYDLLAIEWYGRLEMERLRLGAAGGAPEPRALRELRAHNWEGAAQWLRGKGSGTASSR